MAPIPLTIGDFTVLPISTPPLPSYPKAATHHIYVRQQEPKIPTPDDSRSLFLANVPVDSTETHIRAVFTSLVGAGKFESISFEKDRYAARSVSAIEPLQATRLAAHSKKRKRDEDEEAEIAKAQLPPTWPRELKRSGSTAVVVLADEHSVKLVLKAIAKAHKTRKYPVWGDGVSGSKHAPILLGASWLHAHARMSYPDLAAMVVADRVYHNVFERREKEAKELAKTLHSKPDADGFVTVTRGGAAMRTAEQSQKWLKEREREEKKRKELGSFYRFQTREKQKAEQAETLKKFEEDKQKVAEMKAKRGKFRPEV